MGKLNLVGRLQKVAGIDIKYFSHGTFWSSIPIGSEVLVNLALSVLLTHFLSVDNYGTYKLFQSILLMLFAFSFPGIGTSLIIAVANKHFKSVITATRHRIKLSLIGSGVLAIIGLHYLLNTVHTTLGIMCLIATLLFPFFFSLKTFSDFLVGKEEYRKHAILLTAAIIINGLVTAITAYFIKNIIIIGAVYMTVACITFFGCYLYVIRSNRKAIDRSTTDKKLISFGKHLTYISGLDIIIGQFDKVLIGSFINIGMVGVYSIAQTLAGQNKVLLKPFFRLLLPKLSRQKDRKKTYNLLIKKLWIVLLVSATISLLGILITPFIVRILYPASYGQVIIYAQLLFIDSFFLFPNIVFSHYLTSITATRSLYISRTATAILRLCLFLILLPLFGVHGAIIGCIGASMAYFVILLVLSKKESKATQHQK